MQLGSVMAGMRLFITQVSLSLLSYRSSLYLSDSAGHYYQTSTLIL